MTSRLTIAIDPDRCLASGSCTFHAPDTFDLDDDTMKVVLIDGGDGDSDDAVRAAAESCPNRVITLTEAASGGAS